MSIERDGNIYTVICDKCGAIIDEEYDSFQEAVQGKKDNNWKSINIDGEWEDRCPDCKPQDFLFHRKAK